MSDYWLYKWLDENDINSLQSAEARLSDAKAIEDLREKASAATESLQRPIRDGRSVLAGRGLDLSGQLDCDHPSCRRLQVDNLFRHVWHYFDNIVAADGVAHEVSMHWNATPNERDEWILSHIGVLLYLREIGAESLVTFREKPPACENHWEKHAEDAGLEPILSYGKSLVPALAREARITWTALANGSGTFRFDHPDFEHTVWGPLKRVQMEKRTDRQIERAAAYSVLKRYLAHLTSDVVSSQQTRVPLGSTIALHRRLLQRSKEITTASVAFELQLPVIEGLSTATLMKIRQDEHEHFQRFQDNLRLAIEERLKISSSRDEVKLAQQIRDDLIDPELRKIRDRLAESERLLLKKSVVGIALGSLVTICGVIAGLPPVVTIPATLTPILTMYGQAESKHLEEKRDIALEGMYFLWKAVEHQPHS